MVEPVARTILFADVRDSVGLYERQGDVAASRLILELTTELVTVLEANAGELVKRTGDGIMAAFHEPLAGLSAARSMVERAAGRSVPMGIGLDHGAVVAVDDDYYGTTANVAARLMGLAQPGEVLMTRSVVDGMPENVRALVRLIDRATIKGLSQPADIFRVIDTDAGSTLVSFTVTGVEAPTATSRLRLTFGGEEILISWRMRKFEMGRGGERDLVVEADHVSRNHAAIGYAGGTFVLTDTSTNGTFVVPQGGSLITLKRNTVTLLGSGVIGLGDSPLKKPETSIAYAVEEHVPG